MVAARADMGIVLIFLRKDHLLAGFAFDPEVFFRRPFGQERDRAAHSGKPIHVLLPLARCVDRIGQ